METTKEICKNSSLIKELREWVKVTKARAKNQPWSDHDWARHVSASEVQVLLDKHSKI